MEQKLETKQEEYSETDLGEYPVSWKIMQLKDFLNPQVRAVTKPTNHYKSIGIRSHGKGTFLKPDCNPKKIALETLWEVKHRDLITNITFAWEGAIALVKKEDDGALVSHRFPTYTFNENIVLPEFFQYVILQRWFVNELGLISPGSAGRNRVLRKTDFVKIKVPIPTIGEQKIIAKILTEIKESINNSDNLITSLKEFKKSAMKHLFTYGAVSFEDIDKVELKETEIGMIPMKWEVTELGNISEIRSGGTPSTSKKQYWEDGKIPWVKSGKCQDCYVDSADSFITHEGLDNSSAKMLNPNTVLVAMVGAIVGKTGLLTFSACTNQNVASIYPVDNQKLSYLYLYYMLQSRYCDFTKTEGFVIANLSFIKRLPVPYPDFTEQQRIASILSTIDSKIEAEESKKRALEKMFNSMLRDLMTAKVRVKDLEIKND